MEDTNDDSSTVSVILVSDHAYDRAKERLSLNKKAFLRLAESAFIKGVRHSDTKGSLNKHITKMWFKYRSANNVRIYGENIFLFKDNSLVTVYQLPNNLRKHVKYSH